MKNLIRRTTIGILVLLMATGGMGTVLSANSRPIPTQHHVDSVAQNHREAARPTSDAFLDLAIAMELFSNTHVGRGGNLEGVLYTAIDATMGLNRGNPITTTSPARAVFNYNPHFHVWLRQNQTELSQIAANFAFADIQNPTYYTHALAPLVYFNVFGGRYNAAGERVFDGGANITRNEAIVVIDRLGAIAGSGSTWWADSFGNRANALPAWARDAWIGVSGMDGTINIGMTQDQVELVAGGNLTRLEAALWLWDHLRLPFPANTPTPAAIANRFSDLNNLTAIDGEGVPVNVNMDNVMWVYESRIGQLGQVNTRDADTIMRMADLGIIMGFEDGTFRPFETIRRQDFAIMIMRALEAQANNNYYNLTGRTVN